MLKRSEIAKRYLTCRYVSLVEGPGGIPVIEVDNSHATASISLLGANLLAWAPHGQEAVIWLSDDAKFEAGKSIRGGVPICWPWFGAHESEDSYPAHGFTRTMLWSTPECRTLSNGDTQIIFRLMPDEIRQKSWPFSTELEYHITIGKKLELELITTNLGQDPLIISQALHTYFNVGDVSKVELLGLDGKSYLDKVENFKQREQQGPVTITEEVDRIYLDTADDCIIEDPTLNRHIMIQKRGSHSTVVWNPWQATAEKMGDLGENGYLNMLCVETSNAANDLITINQGEQHRLFARYRSIEH